MSFPSPTRWRSWLPQLPRFSGGPGEITLAGTIANSAGTGVPQMRVFGQWALVYLVSGRGFYRDERGREEDMVPGKWILVFPEMAHAYGPLPGQHWHEVYVCFRGPVFEAWREAGSLDTAHPTGRWLSPAKGVPMFREFFQKVQRRNCSSLEAAIHWQSLLAQVIKDQPRSPETKLPWLDRALDLLEESLPDSTNSLPKIARECGLGYESFRKKFEKALGMPPGRYVLARRIERARRLMTKEPFTNKEIAEFLGFYDEFHFSKVFTRFTGKTPRQYRREIQT